MFSAAVPLLLAGGIVLTVRRLEIAVVCFCLGLVLIQGVTFVSDIGASDRTASISISLIIGGLSYLALTHSKLTWHQAVSVFGFWMAASVVLGVYQALTGSGFVDERAFESTLLIGMWRASGFTNDPNYFSLLCLIGLSLALAFSRPGRWLLILVAIIGIILSGSRAGLITCCVVLFTAAIGGYFSKVRFAGMAIMGVAALGALIALRDYLPSELGAIFDWRSYSTDTSELNSLSYRMTTILAALQAFSEDPIAGIGLGNLVHYRENVYSQVSHNTVIEIAAETGIMGLALYVVLLWEAFRVVARVQDQRTKLTLSLALAALILMSMTLVTHYSRIFFVTLAILSIVGRKPIQPSPGPPHAVGHLGPLR
jgi:O-antigen ligase